MTKAMGVTAETASPDGRLAIIYRPIDQIKPNPANPRRHNRTQIRKLARILRRFGFLVLLLIDSNSVLIAGHARLEAGLSIGLQEVPTIVVDNLTDAEIQAFMIADNRIVELSTWDDKMLAEQLLELSQIAPEFEIEIEIELTGFDMGEIDFRIEGLAATSDQPDPGDAIAADEAMAHERPAVTETGDVWMARGTNFSAATLSMRRATRSCSA
jgi:ParB-like chromosome segregation protein Spo0J